MRIIVLVKQVPDTSELKFDEKGNLIKDVSQILNPFDQYALEEAIRIKNSMGGEVYALTMGPEQARSVLLKCLALGADRAFHINDNALAKSDSLVTSFVISEAIKKIGQYDLIFTGQQTLDGDTGQVGPETAELLNIPNLSYVEKIESIENNRARVKGVTEEGYRIVEITMPALLSFLPPSNFEYSNPSMAGIIKAKSKPYTIYSLKDLGIDPSSVGVNGSKTFVKSVYAPPKKERGMIFTENYENAVKVIIEKLREKGVIK